MNNQRISKIYDYKDVGGNLLFQVVRFEPKSFAQRRPLNNDFVWGLGEVEPVLYRLPEMIQAIQDGKTIFICEGEKDADNLRALGLAATSCPMGAGKWQAAYTKALDGCCEAVVLADKDEPGRIHAYDVASDLYNAGVPVKMIEMPDIEGATIKDVSDWLSAGGTREELLFLVDKRPRWALSQVPDPVINPELQNLINRYGEPYYLSKDGGVTALNQAFWASLHQAEHIQLFEPDEREFYRYDPESGLYSVISEDTIKQEINARMLDVSREQGLPSLERKRNNSSQNHIVAQLKGISEKKNAFRKDNTIVHLANGVIVFKPNGEADFCSFSPDYCSRNQCPIPFDASAKCDRFSTSFLSRHYLLTMPCSYKSMPGCVYLETTSSRSCSSLTASRAGANPPWP